MDKKAIIQLNLFENYHPIGGVVREITFYHRVGIVTQIYEDGYHRCYPIPLRGGDFLRHGNELEFIVMFRPITFDEYITYRDELYRFVTTHGVWLEDFYYKFSSYCGDKNPDYQNWLDQTFNLNSLNSMSFLWR